MAAPSFLASLDGRGVFALTLNRPEVHHALNRDLIDGLTQAFKSLEDDPSVRVVLLKSQGPYFCSGADITWMKKATNYTFEENMADAMALGELLASIDRLSKPVIAVVQGSAFGGGLGLIAACDIAIGVETAFFSLSEVRLGLVPGVISPYVLGAIGERAMRRYALSAEKITAAEAIRLGLLHTVTPADKLEAAAEALVQELLKSSPDAMASTKSLIRALRSPVLDASVYTLTAQAIAKARVSPEGKEGIAAFLEKRKPAWIKS